MNKKDYYVASFSGGKDSTAMTLRLIERGESLDEVIFCDTYKEFPAMYRHIEKIRTIVENNGIRFTVIKSPKSFDYLMFEHQPKRRTSKYEEQKGYSWPEPKSRWCTRELKVNTIKRYLNPMKKQYEVFEYIGYAFDELGRAEKSIMHKKNLIFPLIEWKWDEETCLDYCYEKGFDWESLYEFFNRASCWCCPLQSLDDLRNLRSHFPGLWNELREMDKNTWRSFRANYSVEQLELRFQFEEQRLAKGESINLRKKDTREAMKRFIGEKNE